MQGEVAEADERNKKSLHGPYPASPRQCI